MNNQLLNKRVSSDLWNLSRSFDILKCQRVNICIQGISTVQTQSLLEITNASVASGEVVGILNSAANRRTTKSSESLLIHSFIRSFIF